jgi:diacylglycerol kinase (ATP)
MTVELTQAPGDGTAIAAELAAISDVIGIIGGDGTIHEAVNGLMPDPIPIIILPTGSGNDFASLVDCPRDPAAFTETLHRGYGARVDVLDLGGRFSVNSIGIGFEGEVNRQSHSIQRLSGTLLYVAAVMKALVSLECPDLSITTAEGARVSGRKLLVSLGNGNRAGGAFYLTPDAYPDDGMIDVCVVDAMSRARMMTMLPRAFNGSHVGRPQVSVLRSGSVEVTAERAYPMHVDGEFVEGAAGTLSVTLRPRALPVLCNANAANRLTHPLEKIL